MPTTKRRAASGTVPSTVVATAPRSVVPPRPARSAVAFPDAVHHEAPEEQGQHHPGDGRSGEGAGLDQRESAVVLERRDQEGGAVDRDRRGRLGRHAGAEHRPPPRRGDGDGVGRGHRFTVDGRLGEHAAPRLPVYDRPRRRLTAAAVVDTASTRRGEVDLLAGLVGGRDAAQRRAVVVEDRRRDRGEAGRDLTVLRRVAAPPGLAEHASQRLEVAWPAAVPVHEGGAVGVEGPHLAVGERGHDRPAARGQVGGQSYADVGDQRGPARGALLQHVEDVATVRHREVRRLPDPVHERRQRPVRDALEGGLARVADADLEGGHAQAVAAVLGDVGDEALLDHRVDQVVGRRARQVERRGQPFQRHRVRLGGQEAQHPERARGGRNLTHVRKRSPPGLPWVRMAGTNRASTPGARPRREADSPCLDD